MSQPKSKPLRWVNDRKAGNEGHLTPDRGGLLLVCRGAFSFLYATLGLILSEPVTASLLTGACLVVTGVYLTSRPTR